MWLRSEVLRVALRVPWDMPVWPVWQLTGWVVDPHYLVRLQTFRQRAAEVSLVWRDDTSSVREVVPRLYEGGGNHSICQPKRLRQGHSGEKRNRPDGTVTNFTPAYHIE